MKVISFNINSIRARLHQLEAIIKNHSPDIIGLQETKVHNEQFPKEEIEAMGYHVIYHGQKAHYGVAMLSKKQPKNIVYGFPTDTEDAQKRMIMADFETAFGEIRVLNGYFPQGESRTHETKFPMKEQFYKDLNTYLNTHCKPQQHIIIMGDFNISPEDKDIGIGELNRKRWLSAGKCSFLPEEREWLENLKKWGLTDAYRTKYPDKTDNFSWFDYRSKGFEDNRGLRIDYFLISDSLKSYLHDSGIDYDARSMEKPSDHAPVWVTFN
ncbi:exodeoxyribonuclease III [Thorsellia kenyensis]|uniref:Exodeoxyribonuclease III n=1 Tax=Thorsellia kenyensis TaxID=1549888 RepID=A0ABV6CD80_9GAMM